MNSDHPFIISDSPHFRRFAAFPVAVQAILVNEAGQTLLLNSPRRNHGWQLVSGALEAEETLLDGTVRELHEELGSKIEVRPLGVVHAQTFQYDDQIRFMLGVYYLFDYLGGEIEPGDDMIGSAYRWWTPGEVMQTSEKLHGSVMPWMLERAVELHKMLAGSR